MNEKELKEQLLSAGITEEELKKIDFAKVENIFENATSIEGLCQEMKNAFPDFDQAGFRKAILEQSEDSEKIEDLSEDALSEVAGGSVGSWLNKNKDWIIPIGVIAALGTAYIVKTKLQYDSDAAWTNSRQGYAKHIDSKNHMLI